MTRSVDARFDDIAAAIERCRAYRDHLNSEDPTFADMAFDAILRNLAAAIEG